ncbi:MAG: YfhO family protein, partial [Lachnospira sp.]|nr:YfhO family protein [Lachnospira sp.]
METVNKENKKKSFNFSLIDNTSTSIPAGNITFILSFCIPALIFLALYYLRDIFPFGNDCYLRSDMYHQYAPFYSELWHKLRTGDTLLYSWDIGMGVNFTSLFAYYLASPINWLIALLPQKYMIEIMNMLIVMKLCASSVTFSYYISKHFHTKKCTIALFGMFYALSAYSAAYSWNIMWLDCIVLIPLIMLGLEKLVDENKCYLYCIS